MPSFQSLIKKAETLSAPEAARSMDLRIEIRTHGKPVHLWKLALRLHRHINVIFGNAVTMMLLDNEELVDEERDEDWDS